MNQTRDENLRNNYAAKIKSFMKEKKVEKIDALDDGQKAELLKEFPTFEEAYEFGSRGGAREVDPIRKQAIAFATASVKKAIVKKGMKLADIESKKLREMAEAAIEKYPKFLEKARVVVAAREDATKDLDINLE
jgi:predicted TIM-barrel fold metal-dependent hydrolase